MALSKTTRISILLAIDSAFFLLELIVGSCHTEFSYFVGLPLSALVLLRELFCVWPIDDSDVIPIRRLRRPLSSPCSRLLPYGEGIHVVSEE